MGDIALEIPLGLLTLGRRRQRDDPGDPRAHPLGDALDRPALAGRVAALEHDDDLQALVADPFLELHELDLEPAQLREVVLVLQRKSLWTDPTAGCDRPRGFRRSRASRRTAP